MRSELCCYGLILVSWMVCHYEKTIVICSLKGGLGNLTNVFFFSGLQFGYLKLFWGSLLLFL